MSDVINLLSGATPDIVQLRTRRPEATENAQASFSALLEPAEPGGFPQVWRYAVAAFVSGISGGGRAHEFYRELLAEESDSGEADALDGALDGAVDAAVERGASTGPYASGGFVTFGGAGSPGMPARLAAGLDFAHLLTFHPKDASPAAVGHLQEAGWSDDAIVSLAQLVSFLAFQLRVVHGVSAVAGSSVSPRAAARAGGVPDPGWAPGPRTLTPDVVAPEGFVTHSLGWKPWLQALPKEEFTDRHRDALIQPQRIGSEYFRLLARDPDALKARTLTDLDIFYNTDGGLGRAERELAATVVSRFNGCEFCASVHQARAKEEGGDAAAIDRLLGEGIAADLGSPAWSAIRDAAVALTATPARFAREHVEALRAAGLDDLAVLDVVNASAFFNWANRLMLTLGEPDVPPRFR